MSSTLCPKIIPEGTRLTLETEMAFALNEHSRIVGPLLDPRFTSEVSPKGHLKNIYQKMGAHTRSAVVSTVLANAVTSAETSEPPRIRV